MRVREEKKWMPQQLIHSTPRISYYTQKKSHFDYNSIDIRICCAPGGRKKWVRENKIKKNKSFVTCQWSSYFRFLRNHAGNIVVNKKYETHVAIPCSAFL